MKHFNKIRQLSSTPILFVLFAAIFCLLQTPGIMAAPLPKHWYTLPEDQVDASRGLSVNQISKHIFGDNKTNSQSENELSAAQEAELQQTVSKIYSIQRAAFTEADAKSPIQPPWRFVSYAFDLGISLDGAIGTLILKGSPAVSVYWRKKEKTVTPNEADISPAPIYPNAVVANPNTLSFDIPDDLTETALEKQITAVITAVTATQQIQNETAFREEMSQTIRSLHNQFSELQINQLGAWEPASYRFDFLIDASGKVHLFTSLGVGVRLRLEWHRVDKKVARANAFDSQAQKKNYDTFTLSRREQIESVLETLSMAMNDMPSETHPDFQLKSIRIGLGVSAKGNIGVIKSSVGALVHVSFRKAKKAAPNFARALDAHDQPDHLLLIERIPTKEHIEFAKSRHKLMSLAVDDATNNYSEATYKVDRKDLAKGFRHAARLARIFVRPDQDFQKDNSNWLLHTLKLQLDMSLTGTFGVTPVSGLLSTEMAFENKNF